MAYRPWEIPVLMRYEVQKRMHYNSSDPFTDGAETLFGITEHAVYALFQSHGGSL